MNRPHRKLKLNNRTTTPQPVTIAEWDVTPGLHEWIESEIKQREDTAAPLVGLGTCPDWGHCQPDCTHPVATNNATDILRRCTADRKILAAHPYTTRVINPAYGPHSAGFGCETCHDWDGVPEGRGNCATILALAEAYGLEPPGEQDVEIIPG
ncbi:hypothetical protein [Streptomyces sp. LUP47B]|uniref:hypothetical protein n=1 Tax=Streptomyces sp. LUP47B TaxID=1890286 RepID=UPI0008516A00|nr:hypothetical protein [Streptomyces sp. LUP47B]